MFPIYIEPIWSMVTRPKFGSQIMNFIGHTGGKILDLPAYTSLDTRGKIHFEKTHFYKNGLFCYAVYFANFL